MKQRISSRLAGLTPARRGVLAGGCLRAFVLPPHAQTAPKLSGEDYQEILQLYFQYPLTLDNGDAEGYANLFTEDGSFQNNVGRAALIAFVKGREATTVRHAPLTPIITAT